GPLRAKATEWGKLTLDVLQRAAANPDELGAGQLRLPVLFGPLRAKATEWGKLTLDVLQRAAANPDELGAGQ
ncbi:hypothetical protein C7E25_24890, partial [Stenotrophomonas maltophilia]